MTIIDTVRRTETATARPRRSSRCHLKPIPTVYILQPTSTNSCAHLRKKFKVRKLRRGLKEVMTANERSRKLTHQTLQIFTAAASTLRLPKPKHASTSKGTTVELNQAAHYTHRYTQHTTDPGIHSLQLERKPPTSFQCAHACESPNPLYFLSGRGRRAKEFLLQAASTTVCGVFSQQWRSARPKREQTPLRDVAVDEVSSCRPPWTYWYHVMGDQTLT